MRISEVSVRRPVLAVMIVGALIIFFLIIEPHGLNQLWRLIREKLIIWPFPH